ncbi:hypothetical protein ACF0H5_006883 [Mactra antiquata]
MAWGEGFKSTWGSSGFSTSTKSKDPTGQHVSSCLAGSSGIWSGGHYEENCPGCRRDRSMSAWGSKNTSGAVALISLFTGTSRMRAKKSLWD